ncbi:MAG: type I-E CRISPR-associated protein Cse2/CasB [Armatimonadetes bacterium]|nr:type I-E CRISPR-associated protein Cse2/CasB [Armatimonadota bacterium]
MNRYDARKQALADFVRHLASLAHRAREGDRAARASARASLARLRRGLDRPPGSAPETLEEVLPYLRAEAREDEYARERELYFLIGSLFARHPGHSQEHRNLGNLGATMRALGTDNPSAVQRFTSLLAARRDQLPDLLRQAVSLAAGDEVPVNYYQLAQDLLDWDADDRRVQLAWAREYWPPQARPEPAPASGTTAPVATQEGNHA